ncbi:hypothetical protein V8B97DRAFT_2007819 [Scleroderma yunnanense]
MCIQQQEEAQALHELSIMHINMSTYDDQSLSLLNGLEDLPFDEADGNYYMGGVGGGLGLSIQTEEEYIQALNNLDNKEPDVEDDDASDAGPTIVIRAFSDDESGHNDDPFLDEW